MTKFHSCPRFLDRFRTITNVMGDALGCAIVQHMCAEELAEMDREKELQEAEGGAEELIQRKGDIEMGSSL